MGVGWEGRKGVPTRREQDRHMDKWMEEEQNVVNQVSGSLFEKHWQCQTMNERWRKTCLTTGTTLLRQPGRWRTPNEMTETRRTKSVSNAKQEELELTCAWRNSPLVCCLLPNICLGDLWDREGCPSSTEDWHSVSSLSIQVSLCSRTWCSFALWMEDLYFLSFIAFDTHRPQ